MPFRTVTFDNPTNEVRLIDQRLLPHQFAVVATENYRQTAAAIRDMIVRGAGAIGATAAYGLAQGALHDFAHHRGIIDDQNSYLLHRSPLSLAAIQGHGFAPYPERRACPCSTRCCAAWFFIGTTGENFRIGDREGLVEVQLLPSMRFLSGGDSRDALQVIDDPNRIPAREQATNSLDNRAADFHDQPALRFQNVLGLWNQTLDNFQAGRSGENRTLRLELADFKLNVVGLGLTYVWRIRDNKIEAVEFETSE